MPSSIAVAARPRVTGRLHPPGDKSISHRALLLAALAEGRSTITGLSSGADVSSTRRIIEQLGASCHVEGLSLVVHGGRSRLHAASEALDCGNSGTTMRLLMGMLATIEGRHELVGDRSLSRRPMDRVAVPLRLMGAEVEGVGDRLTPPIRVQGRPLRGIRYATPVPSAQVKSAILLAGLAAEGRTVVLEAQPTRPNTEEMLLEAGAELRRRSLAEGDEIEIEPCSLQPREWRVPADPSQAAFGIVAAVLAQEGHVRCEGLYGDPTRVGFLGVLARMGAAIESGHDSEGLLAVTASSSSLNATIVLSAEIPSVDEVPILTIAAAAASGTTRFVDVGELRIKESDRFAGSMTLARGLGAGAEAEGDDLLITGLGSARQFRRLTIDADGDHRVAMAAAVAGLVGAGAQIEGFEAVATSYPGFLEELAALQ